MPYPRFRHLLPCIPAALLALTLASCGDLNMDMTKPSSERAWDLESYDFSSDIHWNDWDAAYDFVDPKTKLEHPLSPLDSARFKQIEVSGYTVISSLQGKDTVDQRIQLQIINRNTQEPRTIVYHEHWHWDAAVKKWWLTTGLPDITAQE